MSNDWCNDVFKKYHHHVQEVTGATVEVKKRGVPAEDRELLDAAAAHGLVLLATFDGPHDRCGFTVCGTAEQLAPLLAQAQAYALDLLQKRVRHLTHHEDEA